MSEILIGRTLNYKFNNNPQGTSAAGTTTGAPSKDSRTIVGFCSVFGNQDAISDIVMPGAFSKAIADFNNGQSRCRFLWNHDQKTPCASIIELKEVGRADLPASMRAFSDVTGALQITRKYFSDDFSSRVYEGVLSGGIREMSFAFNPTDFEYTTIAGKRIRLLKSLELLDASDVLWACNELAFATVPKNVHIYRPKMLELHLQQLKTDMRREQVARFKFASKYPNFDEKDKSTRVLERARELVASWS